MVDDPSRRPRHPDGACATARGPHDRSISLRSQPECEQLGDRDHAELPGSDRSDPLIDSHSGSCRTLRAFTLVTRVERRASRLGSRCGPDSPRVSTRRGGKRASCRRGCLGGGSHGPLAAPPAAHGAGSIMLRWGIGSRGERRLPRQGKSPNPSRIPNQHRSGAQVRPVRTSARRVSCASGSTPSHGPRSQIPGCWPSLR